MKRVLFFVVVVCVLLVTGGTIVYASSAPVVAQEGTTELTNLILPAQPIEDAAMDYLQALVEVEKTQDLEAVSQLAAYFAEQQFDQDTPLRWWPDK